MNVIVPTPLSARSNLEGDTFVLETDAIDDHMLNLLCSPPGSRSAPAIIWDRKFETIEDRDAVLDAIYGVRHDLDFLGHLVKRFGRDDVDSIVDGILTEARDLRREAIERAAEYARNDAEVKLYSRETRRGAVLELQRASRDEADWKVFYDRATERDRLCDWLRWQKPRFLAFLDYAARHGDEALTRLLTDEMFEAERMVKKEGRGAGGSRPLRMWRGE